MSAFTDDIENKVPKKDTMRKLRMSSDMYKKKYKEYIDKKRKIKQDKLSQRRGIKKEIILMSVDFKNEMELLKKKSGVYILYDDFGKMLYVGQSVSLGDRIPESMACTPDSNRIKYVTTSTSDTYILEIFLINLYKPIYNKQSKGIGDILFRLPTEYAIDKMKTLINKENKK